MVRPAEAVVRFNTARQQVDDREQRQPNDCNHEVRRPSLAAHAAHPPGQETPVTLLLVARVRRCFVRNPGDLFERSAA